MGPKSLMVVYVEFLGLTRRSESEAEELPRGSGNPKPRAPMGCKKSVCHPKGAVFQTPYRGLI